MLSLMKRAFLYLRVCAGLGDPSETRLTPGHGWLLPSASDLPLAPALSPRPVAIAPPSRLDLRG
jgi:hypothetical protein